MALTICPVCRAEVYDLPDHEESGRCQPRRDALSRNQADAELLLRVGNLARLSGRDDVADWCVSKAKQAAEA